ncbi:hypothetical protein ACFVAJ_06445 [Agromyces sp. NPDC057679]|uniref:hypothetical protein n=1 Tax=Agromyces sp. NPDC057679 TaxID=3346207 RepID=UPI00366FC07D
MTGATTSVGDPAETPVVRSALWRRLAGSPLVWAAVCFALTVPWFAAGQGMEFVPYLLMLVGGWLCGFSFVNLTFRIRPERDGVILHVVGAVVAGVFLWVAIELSRPLLETAPEPLKIAFLIVQFAAIPAAGWIWLGLLSRITSAVGRPSKKRPSPVAPEWVRAETGRGSEVGFTAVPMTMRALTTAIVLIVVVVGAVAVVALIAVTEHVVQLGPRFAIFLVGVVFALPAYFIYMAIVQRRTLDCTIGFGDDRLWLRTDASTTIVKFDELDELVWRCRSDYARVELRGANLDVSLITGIAKGRPGFTAELPALPRRVVGRLTDLGFALERSKRDEVLTFRRAVASARP